MWYDQAIFVWVGPAYVDGLYWHWAAIQYIPSVTELRGYFQHINYSGSFAYHRVSLRIIVQSMMKINASVLFSPSVSPSNKRLLLSKKCWNRARSHPSLTWLNQSYKKERIAYPWGLRYSRFKNRGIDPDLRSSCGNTSLFKPFWTCCLTMVMQFDMPHWIWLVVSQSGRLGPTFCVLLPRFYDVQKGMSQHELR